jgi:hypothetical protein
MSVGSAFGYRAARSNRSPCAIASDSGQEPAEPPDPVDFVRLDEPSVGGTNVLFMNA